MMALELGLHCCRPDLRHLINPRYDSSTTHWLVATDSLAQLQEVTSLYGYHHEISNSQGKSDDRTTNMSRPVIVGGGSKDEIV